MKIRKATRSDIPAIASVHVDTWRSAYRGIVPDEYLTQLSLERREKGWHQVFDQASEDNSFIYVALSSSGDVIGFASGSKERTGDPIYSGELTAIYILQAYQGKGIGRCLVGAIARKLKKLNICSMLVWVLLDNAACQFYAALGGQRIYEKTIEIGGKSLTEVAYGWENLAELECVALDMG